MLLILILSLFIGIHKAAEYGNDQMNASHVDRMWDPCESLKSVGYPVNTRFFLEDNINMVAHNRVSIFSPGLYRPRNKIDVAQSIVNTFDELPEKVLPGWLPGDFFIFDPAFAGSSKEGFNKKLSWGQKKDAFALIYSINRLYEARVQNFTLHGQCFGAERCTHALYYLSANEQSNDVENFFMRASIDRLRKEELLASIQSICLQTPLKEASDGILTGPYSNIETPLFAAKLLSALTAQSFLVRAALDNNSPQQNRTLLTGVGIFSIPLIISLSNYLFGFDKKIVRNVILPHYCTYDSSEPDEFTMLKKMQYMINEYPNKSCYMTTAKGDRVVGDKNVAQFFNLFPVSDEHKYLIPSPRFGHCKVTNQQLLAKNAFLRRYGASYYKFPENQLQEGEETLNFAQKGQSSNIEEYITYMESDDNYQLT